MIEIRKLLYPAKWVQIIYIFVFRMLLDYMYCILVSPEYSYLGMTVNFTPFFYILSWGMLFIYSFLITKISENRNKGAVIISILLSCSAIPTTTMVAFLNVDIEFIALNVIYWCLIVLLYTKKGYRIRNMGITLKRTKLQVFMVFLFFAVVILIIGFFYSDFHITFNLYNVYGVRANFKATNIPTLLLYLFYASTIVFPVLLAYALNCKNAILAIGAIVFQVLSYMLDARKSTLFILVVTIGGYYIVKEISACMIPGIITGITLIGIVETIVLGSNMLVNFILRRLFLVPAYLQYAYYDFFKNNTKDYLRQSVVGRLGIASPYSQPIPRVIGDQYYIIGSYANNGLFADAYANLGWLGVIVFPFLIVLALRLLDKCSKSLTDRTCLGLIFISSYTFLSSSFFTVMLTHGFLIGCIIIYLIPRSSPSVLVAKNKGQCLKTKISIEL